MSKFTFAVILLSVLIVCDGLVTSLCPNKCSGHGMCTDDSIGECECFPGYSGGDCSKRVCPAANAWADFPSYNNTAHADFTECSNMVRHVYFCNETKYDWYKY
jgi:hypothetical protein